MGKYFGTDGFRGEANCALTAHHALLIGEYLAEAFGKKTGRAAKIVIGRDTRLSGNMLESALCAGLTECGANVTVLGVVTTPGVAYATRTGGYDCGIMISASHNPFYDNGIKLINDKGEKMEESFLAELEKCLDGITPRPTAVKREQVGTVATGDADRQAYADYLISLPQGRFDGIKVGLDCSNGSASFLAKEVYEALGAEVHVIHHEPNGININAACGSTHIEVLAAYVKEQGLDVGFAYDGDADRCIAVDENGEVVDGDKILYIGGTWLKKNNKLAGDCVVTTIMSNLGLYKAFDRAGIVYEKTAVGDKYVYENMKQNGFSLGGEQSGHVIFGELATTGDGIMTSLMMMEAMRTQEKSLAELCADVAIFPQCLKNIRVKDKAETLADPEVKSAVAKAEECLAGNGRVLVRQSGTEPLIRVMVEAATLKECEALTDSVLAVIRSRGHEV